MRNKRGRVNERRFHVSNLFSRKKRRGEDETDWFLLEADVHAVTPRKTIRPVLKSGWLVRILAIACLCVSVPLGVRWVHDLVFFENEEFVLRDLQVRTDGMLTVANITEVANVSPGMSLLEMDLNAIRERIQKLAIVEEAVISREIPDKLRIDVKERVPVAWLSCPPLGIRPGDLERGFLIDSDGVLFRCLGIDEETSQLPLIETFKMEEPEEGGVFEVDGAGSALELLRYSRLLAGFENMSVHEIRLRNEWSIQCHYRNGLQVTYARHDIRRGMEDLQVILSRADQFGTPLATVNVAASENIPVTFSGSVDQQGIQAIAQPLAEATERAPEDSKQKHLQSILKGG